MKVESVTIKFREGYKAYNLDTLRFDDADYPDLHYMAKEGQHIVNYKADDGRREGKSYPMRNVDIVYTVL